MERRLALALSLCALLGASGALDCSVYEDAVGAQFRHASSRLVPCNAKSQGDSCTYMLNLTRPDGSLHTTDLAVDGCCVQDVSGQYFCSSERSRDASPTALTINKLLRISYQCQGGSVTVSKACDASFGFQTLCQQGAGSPDDNCRCFYQGRTPATILYDKSYEELQDNLKCRCVYPNVGADCSAVPGVCLAGSICQATSGVVDDSLAAGVDMRYWDDMLMEDGSSVLRAKPEAWYGDEMHGTRPMSIYVWWWKNDAGQWTRFDEFNAAALEQAYVDDRSTAVVDFPDFARGTVVVNLGDMTMADSVTPDDRRRQVRRQTSTGQQHVPETLNGRVQVDRLSDTEAVRRASILP